MSELRESSMKKSSGKADSFVGHDLLDTSLAQEVEGEKFLTFRLHKTAYGVEIKRIKEIIEYGGVTRIPMTPPCIRGVLNLRGNVVPVIDLGERLEVGTEADTRKSCIIIVELHDEGEKLDLGFIVDGVDQVVGISDEHIEAAPAFGASIKSEFISGMGNVKNDFVTLLDLDVVLSVKGLGDLVEAAMD
ncbi:MAG: chemotaxis protein CheW [Gammaproteobacteria bacterium]|nr:chemotaxis protein CheW [Gammaproteobacteria bacterium]